MFIRLSENYRGDWYKDLGRLHRGHIVDVVDGINPGGHTEQARADLKILHIDGMTLSEAQAFITPEPGDPLADAMLRRKRMFRLDIDALPPPMRAIIEDASQATTISIPTQVNALRAGKVEIPKLDNPSVIGTEAENWFG